MVVMELQISPDLVVEQVVAVEVPVVAVVMLLEVITNPIQVSPLVLVVSGERHF